MMNFGKIQRLPTLQYVGDGTDGSGVYERREGKEGKEER